MTGPGPENIPLEYRMFQEMGARYQAHVSMCETALGRTALHRNRLMEFHDGPKPLAFEDATELELHHLDPPDEREDSPFFRAAIELTRSGQPYLLNHTRERYDTVIASLNSDAYDPNEVLEHDLSMYSVCAAPEGPPFVINELVIDGLFRGSHRTLVHDARAMGIARDLSEEELATTLRLIEISKPKMEHFESEFYHE